MSNSEEEASGHVEVLKANTLGPEQVRVGMEVMSIIGHSLGKVKEVRATNRLTTSPACLVVDEYGIDPSLQRLLESMGQPVPHDKPILEINPHHPIITKLKDETDEKRFSDWAYILFDQSILSMGEKLDDPVNFVKRLNDLLAQL